MKISPKVFKSNKTQKMYFQAEEDYEAVAIKIQAMEAYTVPHSPIYRIDEEERYPYIPMEKDKDGFFFVFYPFAQEQRYSVKIKAGEELILDTYVYAIGEDLSALKPYKGDTHLHTNRSDGAYAPFETACCYRGAGYDFIAVTDHHKWYPSLECKEKVEPLTSMFTVFLGEEVHNRDMGYFHIINFAGKRA